MTASNIIPVVWQLSVTHLTDNKTLYRGVLLNDSPFNYNRKIGTLRNLEKVLKSYLIKAYTNKDISIISNGKTLNVTTDNSGGFQFIGDFKHFGEIKILTKEQNKPLKHLQSYPILSYHFP